jgi:hypothetical protein
MLPYLYVFPTKEEETQKYVDYLTGYISQKLEHTHGDSIVCVLECIYISVYKEEYKKLKGNVRNIITQLKKFYKELFGKSFPEIRYYKNSRTCC